MNGFTDKRYICLCQIGYTGEHCENGEANENINLIYVALTLELDFLRFPVLLLLPVSNDCQFYDHYDHIICKIGARLFSFEVSAFIDR